MKPDSIPGHSNSFDRFARAASEFVSRAPFFAFCVALVVIWLPTFPFVGSFDTWQLLINTPTTVLTFLLVAVLQSAQRRSERALHAKLDAIADGLADLMIHFSRNPDPSRATIEDDVRELKEAIGLGE